MSEPDRRALARKAPVSVWTQEPQQPTVCPNCDSGDYAHYMAGMYYQGWRCAECGEMFWTHNGVPRSTDEIIAEYKARLDVAESEREALEGEGERLRGAVERALIGLQTLALTDQLDSMEIAGVAKVLSEALAHPTHQDKGETND